MNSASKWKLPSSPFDNLVIIRSAATSVGDALRDLDSRDIITGDFILVFGDLVSNVALQPALAKHRARREKDKNAIMTMVLRGVDPGHRAASSGRQPVFVVDPEHDRCLHYEELGRRSGNSQSIHTDPELLKDHEAIDIRADLIDCNIDICTPDVLGLWSDNFDYTTLRHSFLYGVLKDYELNGKTIHTHIIANQYATRVKNLRMYDTVSKDIIGRWIYPFCPDSNFLEGQDFRYANGNFFREDGVTLSRGSHVKRRVALGRETSLGEQSIVADSTIGNRCKIGTNVSISGSYLWDDVIVGDGTRIHQAIIADSVVLGSNCTVEPGALISSNVRIMDGTRIPRSSKITRSPLENKDSITQTDSNIVGDGGEGFRYRPNSDDESDISSTIGDRTSQVSFSESSISEFSSSEPDLEPLADMSRRSSVVSRVSAESGANRDFLSEETANVLDGLQQGELSENIFLELNARRMGVNASQHEVRQVVVTAFMERISNLALRHDQPQVSVREAVHDVFTKYKEVVKRVIFDKDQAQKADQVDFLLLVQKEAIGRKNPDSLLLFVAKELYDLELVEEDGILQWWGDGRGTVGEMAEVRTLTKQFITFLQEAEEEEESDDSEEEV